MSPALSAKRKIGELRPSQLLSTFGLAPLWSCRVSR